MRTRFSILATALLCMPAAGHAAASSDYEVTYFREAALRTEVGRFYKPCGTGAARLTGKRTRFFVKSVSRCTGGGGSAAGGTLSCHFTEAGCTDALAARVLPVTRPPRN